MTHDIIKLAGEAGMSASTIHTPAMTQFLERFAQLVAAAEREEIAQFIERTELGSLPEETALHYARLFKGYATAIRARGQQ